MTHPARSSGCHSAEQGRNAGVVTVWSCISVVLNRTVTAGFAACYVWSQLRMCEEFERSGKPEQSCVVFTKTEAFVFTSKTLRSNNRVLNNHRVVCLYKQHPECRVLRKLRLGGLIQVCFAGCVRCRAMGDGLA